MVDKADIKWGFWVATGALLAFFLWGLLSGGLGKILGRG